MLLLLLLRPASLQLLWWACRGWPLHMQQSRERRQYRWDYGSNNSHSQHAGMPEHSR
jgi:hypothetical protein